MIDFIASLTSLEAGVYVLIFLCFIAVGIVVVIEWADRVRRL